MTDTKKAPDVYEAQDFITKFIGYSSAENKSDIVYLLKSNGVSVSESAAPGELMTAVYIAIGKSKRFQKDLANYMRSAAKQEYDNFVAQQGFFNAVDNDANGIDDVTGKALTKTELRKLSGQKTAVGTLLQKVATQQNIEALINTGLGIASQKLSAKADQKSLEAAAALAAEKSKQALAEAQAADAKAKRNKWLIPVVIGGVVIVGIAVYFGMKKRK